MARNDEAADGSESDFSSDDETPSADGIAMDLAAAGPPNPKNGSLLLRLKKMKRKMGRLFKALGPGFGLIILCWVYVLIGASIFHAIESPNEQIQREKELEAIFRLQNEFSDQMWNITQDKDNKISKEAFNRISKEYSHRLARVMIRNEYINEKHLLNETDDEDSLWTFTNSIFFATTVLTTIGYGRLVPATTLGRVACIIFALFGIPIMRVTIKYMGELLKEFLRFLYRSYRAAKEKMLLKLKADNRSKSHSSSCGNDDQFEEWKHHIPVFMVVLILLAYTVIGGFLIKSWEDLQYFDAFYSCFIRITTVGFGVNVRTEQLYTFLTIFYIIFGLSLASACIDVAGLVYIRKIHRLGSKMRHVITRLSPSSRVKHTVHPEE